MHSENKNPSDKSVDETPRIIKYMTPHLERLIDTTDSEKLKEASFDCLDTVVFADALHKDEMIEMLALVRFVSHLPQALR